MKNIRFLLIFLLAFQSSAAQTWQDTLSLIEHVFKQFLPENPGCQFSVSRNGRVIFSKAWGMADLERNVPLSTNSILEGGSVSKQFTAAAILLLEQQGKLSLDDDVRKYIPELPFYGKPIRLRQMLHHTSGLRDWGAVSELAGWPRGKKFYTNEDALEIITRQKHLNNQPGHEYLYSNSNYNLFAIIVQRISGFTLADFTRKYIFEPAGMTHTQWRDDPNRVVLNRAIAYSKSGSGYKTDMPNEYVYGNGGLLTTTEDLLKWNSYYLAGKLGTPSLLSKQTQTDALVNGVINPYAAGLFIRKVNGWNNINHSGATAGYRAYLEAFPELNISLAVLSNTSQFNINEVAAGVRKIFVPDNSEKIIQKDKSVNLSDAALKGLAGMYLNERDGSTFKLSVKDKTIMLDDELPMMPLSENILKADNFRFEIKGTKGVYLPASIQDTIPFKKVDPVVLSQKDLLIYEGKYFSEETNSSITIQHRNDTLMIHLKPGENDSMVPTYADAFKIDALGCDLLFTRNSAKKIVGIKMNLTRARNVQFKKIK